MTNDAGVSAGMFVKRRRGRPRGSSRKSIKSELYDAIRYTRVGPGYVNCDLCHKVLKETSVYIHRQTHLGIKKFGCDFCGKKFVQKAALITHRRIHTGEKPYQCPHCQKAFAAHSGLLQHKCPNND